MPAAHDAQATLPDDAQGFIASARWVDTGSHGRALPPAFVVEFNAHTYSPAAFARLGFTCPAQIQRAVTKRQAEFLAGRVAARQAMARLGMNVAQLQTGAMRQPLWPQEVTGSITHTDRMAAAIAVPSGMVRGVGIDIENIVENSAADAIRAVAMREDEQGLIAEESRRTSANMLLTIIFSAKESFFKATSSHVGRYFDFHALRLCNLDMPNGRLVFTVAEALSPILQPGKTVQARFRVVDAHRVLTSFIW